MDEIVKTDEQIAAEAKKLKWAQVNQVNEDLKVLMGLFPKCFDIKTRRPLKIGIKEDMMKKWGDAAPFDKGRFDNVMKRYVRSNIYLKSFETEQYRCGINGEQAQAITEEERVNARKMLEGRNKNKAAKMSTNTCAV